MFSVVAVTAAIPHVGFAFAFTSLSCTLLNNEMDLLNATRFDLTRSMPTHTSIWVDMLHAATVIAVVAAETLFSCFR